MTEEPPPLAHTKHGDLSLDEIGEMMPGMARLMVEVSDRFWILYYAAQGGNWRLARHEFSEMRKAMRMAAVTRPKYRDAMAQYEAEHLAALEAAIQAREWSSLEAAYRAATDAANELHREFGYEYIDWRLPPEPPQHLRLSE